MSEELKNEIVTMETEETVENQEHTGTSAGKVLLIGAAVVGLAIAGVKKLRKRKKKQDEPVEIIDSEATEIEDDFEEVEESEEESK